MMPFKMSENSLFALLLRSPWWASALVTLAIVALSFALLPSKYVIFGLAVALPFPVIAGIAAWRQWQAPSTSQVDAIRERVAGMNWKQFAVELEQAWSVGGMQVARLDKDGADFELTQGWRKTVVSARRWKTAQVGVEPVRAVLAAREASEANGAMIVALGDFSAAAKKLAEERAVQVLDAQALARLLQKR